MKITAFFLRGFLGISASALLMAGCVEMQGSSTSSGGLGASSSSSAPVPSANVASGHAGDTLKACLGRIPGNATNSQRMLAEVTCQRDEGDRQSIKAVPGN